MAKYNSDDSDDTKSIKKRIREILPQVDLSSDSDDSEETKSTKQQIRKLLSRRKKLWEKRKGILKSMPTPPPNQKTTSGKQYLVYNYVILINGI